MSLKCSLFGHRYGDSEVRRDREQDGSELVETIQEVKLCDRCGEHLVISETTEVTTVEAAGDGETETDAPSDDTAPATGESSGTPHNAGTTSPPAGSSNGQTETGGTPGRAGTAGAGSGDAPDRGDATGRGDTPVSGDIPGGGDATGGPHTGEAPDGQGGPGRDPSEQERPPTRKDDAVLIDEEGEEQPVTEWPGKKESDQQETEWEPDTELTAGSDTDNRPERPTQSSGGLTVPEGEFHCPECGFSTTVESSSLREGDFCPECHHGALEHHAG